MHYGRIRWMVRCAAVRLCGDTGLGFYSDSLYWLIEVSVAMVVLTDVYGYWAFWTDGYRYVSGYQPILGCRWWSGYQLISGCTLVSEYWHASQYPLLTDICRYPAAAEAWRRMDIHIHLDTRILRIRLRALILVQCSTLYCDIHTSFRLIERWAYISWCTIAIDVQHE